MAYPIYKDTDGKHHPPNEWLPRHQKNYSPFLCILIPVLLLSLIIAVVAFINQVETQDQLDCARPWVVMSPGLATAHDARINLDQHGAWIIQAENWLVIWDQEGAVAAHGLDAWEAQVHLASSPDPEVCGFIQVIMGDPLVIPDRYDIIESLLL